MSSEISGNASVELVVELFKDSKSFFIVSGHAQPSAEIKFSG
jgi:hypothetical protein